MVNGMRNLCGVVLGAVAFFAFVGPAFAHHSFSAEFTDQDPIELTGVLTKVDWINPHVYLYLDVKDKNGKVTTWSLEGYPTHWFAQAGLKKSMLGEGQTVTISAFRAKDGTKQLGFLRKITYADGHFYQLFTDDAVLH